MRKKMVFLLALMAGAQGAVAAVMPLDEAAQKFGARPTAFSVDLSPSGSKLVFLIALEGARTGVRVLDLKSRAVTNVVASTGKPEALQYCEFATEVWLICQYGGNAPYDDMIIPFSRMVAINILTKELKKLSSRQDPGVNNLRQDDGAILDLLPDDPNGAILMARTYIGNTVGGREGGGSVPGLAVDRIDLETMKHRRIEPARNDARFYLTDGTGNVRLVAIDDYRGGDSLTGKMSFRVRPRTGGGWRDLGKYDSTSNEGMYPIAVDGTSDSIFYLQKLNGRDALYRMPLDGGGGRPWLPRMTRSISRAWSAWRGASR